MSTATAELAHPSQQPQSGARRGAWLTYAICLVVLAIWTRYCVGSLLHTGRELYRDYGSFYASGLGARQQLNPYDSHLPHVWHFYENGHNGRQMHYDTNLNAPSMLPFFELLSLLNFQQGLIAWSTCSALAMAAGTALLLWRRPLRKPKIVWLLLAGAVWGTLWAAQVYTFLFLFACVIWFLIDSGKLDVAAVLTGILVAIKPNLGLWLLMLFLARYWRFAIISSVTAVIVSILPVLRYGPGIYRKWPAGSAILQGSTNSIDISLMGVFTRLGSRPFGAVAALLVAAITLYMVYRRRPPLPVLAGIGVCAGILCSPLAWFDYVLFAAPFFAALSWRRLHIAAAIFFFPAPFWFPLFLGHSPTTDVVLTACYFTGACIMLYVFLNDPGVHADYAARRYLRRTRTASPDIPDPISRIEDGSGVGSTTLSK